MSNSIAVQESSDLTILNICIYTSTYVYIYEVLMERNNLADLLIFRNTFSLGDFDLTKAMIVK